MSSWRRWSEAAPDDAAGRLTALKEAVANSDSNALENRAHSLKGIVASLALNRVQKASAALEDAGATGVWDGTTELVAELEWCLEAGTSALRAELE
jgi:HPt (histidine-containing phosphotransfer) domain-containing protein